MNAKALVARLASQLLARGERLATAESCTGGLIAKLCTDTPGSSAWFERGLIPYSNEAKHSLLGVPLATLAAHGAVSEAVVRAMAQGLLERAPVQQTVAVSGVAGPSGGSAEKPVGTVWIAWATPRTVVAEQHFFTGNRESIREQAARVAMEGLLRHA